MKEGFGQEVVAEPVVGGVEFQHRGGALHAARAWGLGGEQVDVGGDRNGRPPYVIDHRHEAAFGECRDLQIFGYAAERADLGLGDVECFGVQEIAPAPAGELRLAAGDRGLEPGAERAVAVAVFRGDRLLEPAGLQVVEGVADFQRLGQGIGVVGVDHEREIVADAAADRFGEADVVARADADLHLGGDEAGVPDPCRLVREAGGEAFGILAAEHHAVTIDGNAFVVAAADEPAEGKAGGLAGDVPERDVDAGQRLDRHALLAVIAEQIIDVMPEDGAVARVAAEDHRPDDLLDDGAVGERDIAGAEALAPAGEALVGSDLDQVRGAPGVELLGVAELLRQVVGEDVTDDVGDLHGGSSGREG